MSNYPAYPDIVRRDGMLFFACSDNDRATIATSIERLIDMLDEMEGDPDLEPYLADCEDDREGDLDDGNSLQREGDGWADFEDDGSAEPSLGAPETHPLQRDDDGYRFNGSQANWARGDSKDLEEEHDGREPDLGFVGIGTGWRGGEETDDREGGNELDLDNSDYEPWLGWSEDQGQRGAIPTGDEFPRSGYGPAWFDGSGQDHAQDLIRGLPIAAKRADAYLITGGRP